MRASAGSAIPAALGSAAVRNGVPSRRTAVLCLAYLSLALLLALPLMLVEVPMGVDTLNHLARVHVQVHIAWDADIARLFALRGTMLPYMGLDWAMAPFVRMMPTLLAGRVFIILLLWGMVFAVALLQRVFTGRVGFEPLLVGMVSYNGLLAWGFLNYLFGFVCALLGFAAWHSMRARAWGLRLLVFTGTATSLFFVHLLALALYGAMLGAYEVLGRPRAWRTPVRDWLLLGLQFVPAAALWFWLITPPPLGGPAGLSWLLANKPAILASPFVFADALGWMGVGLPVFLLCFFLLILRLTGTGSLRWNRGLAAPAAALAVLGVVAPNWLLGVALVDLRFPLAAACLAIAALGATPGHGRRLLPLSLAAGAAMLAQIGSVTKEMRACGLQYDELRTALVDVPRGAVLVSVLEDRQPASGVPCTNLPIYMHMPQLITLDRSGYSPGFFSRVTTVAVRDGRATDEEPISAAEFTPAMLPQPGHLLWMHLGNTSRPLPPGLGILHRGSFFDLLVRP